MLNDAFSVVSRAFVGAFSVFEGVLSRLDAVDVVIAVFAVGLVLSLIIAPIRGSSLTTGASDDANSNARRKNK